MSTEIDADVESATSIERRTNWGGFVEIHVPHLGTYECAIHSGRVVHTNEEDETHPLNRAVKSMGYASAEAHR